MEKLTRLRLEGKLRSSRGKIFSVKFKKKNGDNRTMLGRFNTSIGVKGTGNQVGSHVTSIKVLDMSKTTKDNPAWRSINLETVYECKVNGKEYKII